MPSAPDWSGSLDEALKSLESFNIMAHSRHAAGYSNTQEMTDWILDGKWIFDHLGNYGRLRLDLPPSYKMPRIVVPRVIHEREFRALLKPHGLEDKWYVSDVHFCIPPDMSCCASCGLGWNMDNAHLSRAVRIKDFEFTEVEEWVGKSWMEIPRGYRRDSTTSLFTPTTPIVRCADGVVRTAEHKGDLYIPYDYKLQPGDAMSVAVYEFRHAPNSCPF